jgi:tryptophanyl-tRNA synthetase
MSDSDESLQAKVVSMVLTEPKKRATRKTRALAPPVAPVAVAPPVVAPPVTSKADNLKLARAKRTEIAASKALAAAVVDEELQELRRQVEADEKVRLVKKMRKDLRAASRRIAVAETRDESENDTPVTRDYPRYAFA